VYFNEAENVKTEREREKHVRALSKRVKQTPYVYKAVMLQFVHNGTQMAATACSPRTGSSLHPTITSQN